MGFNIRCTTLFDITKTNITNRKPPVDLNSDRASQWQNKRNTQCNFDTIMQVISLRAQPEVITDPIESIIDLEEDSNKFGFMLKNEENRTKIWNFEFYVNHSGVFSDDEHELGALYSDCDNVPMIKVQGCHSNLPNFLDISPELRNIYFEIIENG
jgi:hypothetical protein